MKLLTQKIRRQIPALYATEETPLRDKTVVCKFFTPDSAWTWYVIEGSPEGEDFCFWGFVQGLEGEFGYFMLSELESCRGPLGLPIERDLHFEGVPVRDVKEIMGAIR